MSYQADTARYREMVSRKLDASLFDPRIPARLQEAMSYSLGGGKLLRPCLTLASCEMLGGSAEDVLPIACGIEMIHTYSIIHDDLPAMDNDDYRRGKPSNHKVFGEGMAILAGDGLLSYAFEIMLAELVRNGGEAGYLRAVHAVAEGAGVCGMVGGQAVDIESAGDVEAGADMLQNIHTRKTGALIKASVMAGAYVAHAGDLQLRAMAEFGSLFGLLFQITDDILDVSGSFMGMGKSLGKDQAAKKLTYVSYYGLETARQMAEDTAQRAKDALSVFGQAAEYFIELTDSTLRRDH